MRKVFLALGLMSAVAACTQSKMTGGDGVGNGGDGLALTFRKAGEAALQQAETYDGASPRVDYPRLQKIFASASIATTETSLEVEGIEVDAKNFPDTQKIVLNRGRIQPLTTDEPLLQTLALHEILGLAQIPDRNFEKSSILMRYDPIKRKPVLRKVDFLFVVDDSGSMAVHQRNLADNIEFFISKIVQGRVDYQVGVVTTSQNERCFPQPCKTPGVKGRLVAPFVTPFTPNGLDLIRKSILVGTSGDGVETPFQQIQNLLTLNHPENTGFIRNDASLELLIVTDAEEQSGMRPQDLIALFRSQKPDPVLTISLSLFMPLPGDSLCQTDSPNISYTRYYDVMTPLHGGLHNLCAMPASVSSYSLMIHNRYAP